MITINNKQNENWNEICYLLSENNHKIKQEQDFEVQVVQALRVMGWVAFKGEIDIRPSFQIGAANKIIPDFIIQTQEKKRLFVIEIKLPSIPLTSQFQQQLFSYMRQLKLEYGILIGHSIQLFYDGDLTDSDDPVLLDTIEFTKDNVKGLAFVELFSKYGFKPESLKTYTKHALTKINREQDKIRVKQKLLSQAYKNELLSLIKQDLLNKYDSELIDSVLRDIEISISSKSSLFVPYPTDGKSEPDEDPTVSYSRDKTKYLFNNSAQKLGKSRFVLELVSAYIKKYPSDFETLKGIFKDEYQGSSGVINRLDYVETKYANKSDKRHFIGHDEILTSSDNIKFVVSTQWGKFNVDSLVKLGKELGFSIEETE